MKTYRYKGLSSSGAEVEGVVEGFDQQDAVAKARENCKQLISVSPIRNSKMDKIMNADLGTLFSGGKIKPKPLSLLCSQMAIELRAGLPLVSSLRLVAQNETDKQLKQLLLDVADDVHAGNGLADSFAVRGEGLPNSFIETVRAGEESGKLDECFTRLKKYYVDAADINSKVGSAMIYPIMLICVAVVVIGIIMVSAVPVFEDAFAGMGNQLPFPTRMLIAISHFMTDNFLILAAIVLSIVIILVVFGKTDKGRHLYSQISLSFPGLGLVNQMKAASQFASTLGTMLAAGLPMVEAVKITADTMDCLLVSEDVKASANGILEGSKMCDGLKKSKWLPNLLVEMTSVGEETGKLEDTLGVVSEYYNKEVDSAVHKALEIMNPVITITMAIIVVFILLSVYLPLFSMYGSM